MLYNIGDTLNVKELMSVLKIGKTYALTLLKEGIIEGHKVGGKWLIFREDVEEFIARS